VQGYATVAGDADLRMHQLFAKFVRETLPVTDIANALQSIAQVQTRRLVTLAELVSAAPNRGHLVSLLSGYATDQERGTVFDDELPFAEETVIGRALLESGQFAAARPWSERAVAQAEQGDIHGRVDQSIINAIRRSFSRAPPADGGRDLSVSPP
jgi:putative intracellular protease/amidase